MDGAHYSPSFMSAQGAYKRVCTEDGKNDEKQRQKNKNVSIKCSQAEIADKFSGNSSSSSSYPTLYSATLHSLCVASFNAIMNVMFIL